MTTTNHQPLNATQLRMRAIEIMATADLHMALPSGFPSTNREVELAWLLSTASDMYHNPHNYRK